MASSNLPIILLVPGAFGPPASFDPLLPYLTKAGFSTRPGPYPSCDPADPTTTTCAGDISSLRDGILRPLIENEHKDVVLLVHSYGGVVGGAAATGLDKPTRVAKGQAGGVVGLIYVVGNITLEGETLLQAVGGAYPPFMKVNKPSAGLALIEPPAEIFYNDCDPELASQLGVTEKPHALLAFETQPTAPAWADKAFDGRRTYVRTLDDCCNPSFLQDQWIQKSGVEWDVVDFKTGHFPFVSQPEALAAQIAKSINGFLSL